MWERSICAHFEFLPVAAVDYLCSVFVSKTFRVRGSKEATVAATPSHGLSMSIPEFIAAVRAHPKAGNVRDGVAETGATLSRAPLLRCSSCPQAATQEQALPGICSLIRWAPIVWDLAYHRVVEEWRDVATST